MDREAWRAIVHGVADSRTRLKRLSTQMEAPSKHSIKTGYYYPAGTHGAAPFSFLLLTGLQTSASRYPPKSRAWALRKRRDTPSPGASATFLSRSLSKDTWGTRGQR